MAFVGIELTRKLRGTPAGAVRFRVHRFADADARDEWVAASKVRGGAPGYRRKVSVEDAEELVALGLAVDADS